MPLIYQSIHLAYSLDSIENVDDLRRTASMESIVTSNAIMANIDTLPAPLPLFIIQYLPDLKTLYALRLSSPLFAAVLDLHAVEMFEPLMLKSLAPDVVTELRTYILLCQRTPGAGPPTTDELDSVYKAARLPLSSAISSPVIGHALHAFCKLSSACEAIFDQKLQQFYELPHEHLADKRWGRWSGIRKNYGIPYELPPPSPPDWVEHQRLLRAAFRVRIWQMAGACPEIPKEPLESYTYSYHLPLSRFSTFRRWISSCREPLIDEVAEMAESLDELQDHDLTWDPLTARSPLDPDDANLRDYSEPPRSWDYWMVNFPRGRGYFLDVAKWYGYSPLKGASWRPLRRLGLGIWSDRRLYQLGLQDPAHQWRDQGDPKPIKTSVLTYNCVLWTWNKLHEAAVAAESTDGQFPSAWLKWSNRHYQNLEVMEADAGDV